MFKRQYFAFKICALFVCLSTFAWATFHLCTLKYWGLLFVFLFKIKLLSSHTYSFPISVF